MSSNGNSSQTPNMMTPEEAFKGVWEVLGIDRTKDRLTIKRAYAALAKKTHPEEDPEGFQKLHNAYKGALIYASIPAAQAVPVAPVAPLEEKKEEPAAEDDGLDFSFADSKESSDTTVDTAEEKKEESADKDGGLDFSFADNKEASEEKKEEPADEDDGLDFSFVDKEELSMPRMIEDAIVSFKANNGIDSLTSLKRLQNGNRKRLTEILFSQYCNLAVTSKDVSVWDIFFQEKIVQWYLPDEAFRRFLENAFREGDPNRDKLIEMNRKYEESLPKSERAVEPVPDIPLFVPASDRKQAAPVNMNTGQDKIPPGQLAKICNALCFISAMLLIFEILGRGSSSLGLLFFVIWAPITVYANIRAIRYKKGIKPKQRRPLTPEREEHLKCLIGAISFYVMFVMAIIGSIALYNLCEEDGLLIAVIVVSFFAILLLPPAVLFTLALIRKEY